MLKSLWMMGTLPQQKFIFFFQYLSCFGQIRIETYVRGYKKTTFHYAHVLYIVCWTCFGSFVGHVALVYLLLYYNYPKIKKIKKRQLKLEHKIQRTNVVGKNLKPFVRMWFQDTIWNQQLSKHAKVRSHHLNCELFKYMYRKTHFEKLHETSFNFKNITFETWKVLVISICVTTFHILQHWIDN
jgi:hypothetical protein